MSRAAFLQGSPEAPSLFPAGRAREKCARWGEIVYTVGQDMCVVGENRDRYGVGRGILDLVQWSNSRNACRLGGCEAIEIP